MIKVNGIELKFKQFPNNETLFNEEQFKIALSYQERCKVTLKYETDQDLINLLFVKRFIEAGSRKNEAWTLDILYMPYSRMDRSENGSAFTLKYITEFINSLNFDQVIVNEPHSDVCVALLNNVVTKYTTVELLERIAFKNLPDGILNFNPATDYLCFPDSGAEKRYSKMVCKGTKLKVLVGIKHRDFASGRIVRYQMIGDENLQGGKVIIIDDLCSRGGTFDLASQELKKMNAGDIYLIVGHCEKTIYDGELLKPESKITKVFTTNSILPQATAETENPKLAIFEL